MYNNMLYLIKFKLIITKTAMNTKEIKKLFKSKFGYPVSVRTESGSLRGQIRVTVGSPKDSVHENNDNRTYIEAKKLGKRLSGEIVYENGYTYELVHVDIF